MASYAALLLFCLCTLGSCLDFIPDTQKCDGYSDCIDGSDELPANCPNTSSIAKDWISTIAWMKFCPANQVPCSPMQSDARATHCIPIEWVCDGKDDCEDGSEERGCEYKCPGDDFACSAQQCIPREWVCDGVAQCTDGKDENSCLKLAFTESRLNSHEAFDNEGFLFYRSKGEWLPVCTVGNDEMFDNLCKITGHSRLRARSHQFIGFGNFSAYASPPSSLVNPNYEDFKRSTHCSSFYPVHLSCDSGACGIASKCTKHHPRHRAKRIVGGIPAGLNCHPWAVALYQAGSLRCMAMVLSNQWLLTAAHCFRRKHERQMHWVARLGFTRQRSRAPHEEARTIDAVIFHPEYHPLPIETNDIALIRMKTPVVFSEYIQPPCLPGANAGLPPVGLMCYVVGWGYTKEFFGDVVDDLQQVNLEVMDRHVCNRTSNSHINGNIRDGHLCMSHGSQQKDACQGDSGGPLMCRDDQGKDYLAGVTSTGFGCARPNVPGIWTLTSKYVDWINAKLVTPSDILPVGSDNKCSGFRCRLGECLYSFNRCDGTHDCLDGSDEEGCP